MVADCKMNFTNENNWKFFFGYEDDYEGNFTESPSGRNPFTGQDHSEDDDDDSDVYTYYSAPVTTDIHWRGTTITSTFSQILKDRRQRFMKCPPIIASDKQPKYQWEDKPLLVMKIAEGKMTRGNEDAPQDVSPLSSTSTEKEVPPDSGLVQDRHQSEDKEPGTANLLETTGTCSSQVDVREEDKSQMVETNQTMVKEEKDTICGTNVQQLEIKQKPADEVVVKDQEDGQICDPLEDKDQVGIRKNSISETQRCCQELEDNEGEHEMSICQLGEDMSTLKVPHENFESGLQQLTEDDSYKDKVQLEELIRELYAERASCKMLIAQLEDKVSDLSEQMRTSATKIEELVQQLQKSQDKEQKVQMQCHQLLQQKSQLEDSFEPQQKKKKKRFSLICFNRSSKLEKEARAQIEEETNVTEEAAKKKRKNVFTRMFQRVQSFLRKRTG